MRTEPKYYPPEVKESVLGRLAAGETVGALSESLGIPVSTICTWRAVERGPKERTTPPVPKERVNHDARQIAVLDLHNQGLGTYEIGRRLGIHHAEISKVKTGLGISANSEAVKLPSDIERVVATLEGWACGADVLAGRVEASQISFNEVEIKRCLRSLSGSVRIANRLRNALKQKRP